MGDFLQSGKSQFVGLYSYMRKAVYIIFPTVIQIYIIGRAEVDRLYIAFVILQITANGWNLIQDSTDHIRKITYTSMQIQKIRDLATSRTFNQSVLWQVIPGWTDDISSCGSHAKRWPTALYLQHTLQPPIQVAYPTFGIRYQQQHSILPGRLVTTNILLESEVSTLQLITATINAYIYLKQFTILFPQ